MTAPLFVSSGASVRARLLPLVPLALVGALLGLLAGGATHRLQQPTYTATVAVELSRLRNPVDLNPIGAPSPPLSIDTDAQLAVSDAVVLAVAAQQQRSVEAVTSALSTSARAQSRILLISYTASSADAAEGGVRTAATRYLEERDRVFVQPQRSFLEAVERSTQAIDPEFDLVVTSSASSQRETLRRRAFAEVLDLPSPGHVIEEARLTSVEDRGDIEIPITSGLASGALAGVGVRLLLDMRNRSRMLLATPAAAPARRRPRRRMRAPRLYRVLGGVAAMTVAGTVGGVAVAELALTPTYVAGAQILVPPLPGNAFASRGSATLELVDLETESGVARSDDVMQQVAAGLGQDVSVDVLRGRTRVDPSGRGEVLEITYQSADRAQAQRTVELIAEAVLEVRKARARAAFEARSNAVSQEIADAGAELDIALGPAGDPDVVNALNRRLSLLRTDARNLLSFRDEAGSVISSEVRPNPLDSYLGLAAVLGGPVLGLSLGLLTRGGARLPSLPVRRFLRRGRTRVPWVRTPVPSG